MMRGLWGIGALALFLGMPAPAARAADAPLDVVALLHKVQAAARELDYSGVITYQQGANVQSARLIHVVDGTGERGRLEILDGAPREYLRHNDAVQCLIPDQKTILVEPGRADRFPGLILGDAAQLADYYQIRQAEVSGRIAGQICTIYELHPRDEYRYGYKLCVDPGTNLLLKEQTINAQGEIVDQIAFSTFALREQVQAEQLASPWDTRGWKVVQHPLEPVDALKKGWRVSAPSGFKPVTQVSRPMNSGKPVKQLVYSDGLAVVSVFIETAKQPEGAAASPKRAARNGAINIYGARIGAYWVTAIGEVPAITLRELVERTEYVPLAVPQ